MWQQRALVSAIESLLAYWSQTFVRLTCNPGQSTMIIVQHKYRSGGLLTFLE